MRDLILLGLVVVGATAMWPLNRWAMLRQARTESLGIVLSAVLALGATTAALWLGQPLFVPVAIGFGALAGVAYAVGFVLIIFHCLKIGPAGATVTMNNMGLLWPVLIDIALFSGGKNIPALTWAGVIATVLALTFMGWGHAENGGATPVSKRWTRWALVGWMFSGVSMGSQFLSSHFAPQAPFAFVVFQSLVALAILLIVSLVKRNGALRREEIIAGTGTAIMMIFVIPLTLMLLTRISSAIVFPVTVAGPAVLMLLIGHFVLKERLSPMGWTASLLGIAGIVLLSLQ